MANSEAKKKFYENLAETGALDEYKAEVEKLQVLKEEAKEERKKKVKEEGGRTCDYKDCEEKGKERCAACNFAYYCGKECQVKAWGEHKEECKEIGKEFKTVLVRKAELPPWYDPVMNTVTQGAFRVQVAKCGYPQDKLFIKSNQENTSRISGYIPKLKQKTVYNKLKTDIEKKGFSGNNGFYMAVVKENKAGEETMTLDINLERMLPAQSWAPAHDFNLSLMTAAAFAMASADSTV